MSIIESKNREALEILLGTLEENPDLWETRKKTAKLLYEDEKYLESADILWGAPEIPSTDVDVAFALQVISRVKPNRSIRLIYEVLRRNQSKPLKNMAVARALNDVGLYMEAARFYGAAVADDPKLFNLAFEKQMLWLDDSKRLAEEWRRSDQEAKIPLEVPAQDIPGGVIKPTRIHNEIDEIARGVENPNPVRMPSRSGTPVATQPLIAPGGKTAPAQSAPVQSAPAANMNGQNQAVVRPGLNTGVPNQQPAVTESQSVSRPLLVAGSPTQKLQKSPEVKSTPNALVHGQASPHQAQGAAPMLRRPAGNEQGMGSVMPQQPMPTQQMPIPTQQMPVAGNPAGSVATQPLMPGQLPNVGQEAPQRPKLNFS